MCGQNLRVYSGYQMGLLIPLHTYVRNYFFEIQDLKVNFLFHSYLNIFIICSVFSFQFYGNSLPEFFCAYVSEHSNQFFFLQQIFQPVKMTRIHLLLKLLQVKMKLQFLPFIITCIFKYLKEKYDVLFEALFPACSKWLNSIVFWLIYQLIKMASFVKVDVQQFLIYLVLIVFNSKFCSNTCSMQTLYT